MTSQPGRDRAGRDLAAPPGIKPRNMLTQLAGWTRLGFLAKTGQGRYAIPGPSRAGYSPGKPVTPMKWLPVDTRRPRLTTRHCPHGGAAGALDPGDHCDPSEQQKRAGHEPAPPGSRRKKASPCWP